MLKTFMKLMLTISLLLLYTLAWATPGEKIPGVIILNNGDTLSGEIASKNFSLKTHYGKYLFKSDEISIIIFKVKGKKNCTVTLRKGDKLSGVLLSNKIEIDIGGGRLATINSDEIKKITFKASNVKALTSGKKSVTSEPIQKLKIDSIQRSSDSKIGTNKSTYNPEEPIIVHFRGAPGNENDWICMVAASAPEDEPGNYAYTGAGVHEGTLTFLGKPTGDYEVRAYYNYSAKEFVVTARQHFRVVAKRHENTSAAKGGKANKP